MYNYMIKIFHQLYISQHYLSRRTPTYICMYEYILVNNRPEETILNHPKPTLRDKNTRNPFEYILL